MALKWKLLIPAFFGGLGAVALVLGVTAIYPPAGLIVGGIILLAVGLLPDWGV